MSRSGTIDPQSAAGNRRWWRWGRQGSSRARIRDHDSGAIPRQVHCVGQGRQAHHFKHHPDRAKLDVLPVLDAELRHRHAFHERAIGRAEVFEQHPRIRHRHLAMMRGDGLMIDDKIVVLTASDTIDAGLELDFPGLGGSGIDE